MPSVAVIALVVFNATASSASQLNRHDVAPQSHLAPKDSVGCEVDHYHSEFPIGGVFSAALDKPGPAGNEIKNIAAVVSGGKLLGWFYTAFDGASSWEPLVENGSMRRQFGVSRPASPSFNAKPWIDVAIASQNNKAMRGFPFELAPTVADAARKSMTNAQLTWCFSKDWDGV